MRKREDKWVDADLEQRVRETQAIGEVRRACLDRFGSADTESYFFAAYKLSVKEEGRVS